MDSSTAKQVELAAIGYELVSLSSRPLIPSSSVSTVPSLTHDFNKLNFDHQHTLLILFSSQNC